MCIGPTVGGRPRYFPSVYRNSVLSDPSETPTVTRLVALEKAGFIERSPGTGLMVTMDGTVFRLTEAGRKIATDIPESEPFSQIDKGKTAAFCYGKTSPRQSPQRGYAQPPVVARDCSPLHVRSHALRSVGRLTKPSPHNVLRLPSQRKPPGSKHPPSSTRPVMVGGTAASNTANSMQIRKLRPPSDARNTAARGHREWRTVRPDS